MVVVNAAGRPAVDAFVTTITRADCPWSRSNVVAQ
jgi:hypothetical protein